MPPRKSIDLSKAGTADEGTPAKESQSRGEGINVEDLNLPKSIVTRLAKGVLPPNTQIQGNAMLAMMKSATVFVNYLATHANENTQRASRKTIAPQDVIQALDELEFPEFMPRLEAELARFIELQTDKRNTYRKKVAADKAAGKMGSPPPMVEEEGRGDGQPVAKKARVEGPGGAGEGDGDGDVLDATHGEEDEGENEGAGSEQEGEEDEDEQEEEGEEERHDSEEQDEEEEEAEEREVDDEALDNGEDSD